MIILQKKATRVMTFSKFDAHSSPLFKQLKIIKSLDLVNLHITIFMQKFHNSNLPVAFNNYFTPVNQIHNYNTSRLASKLSHSISKIRTNYGIFNLRYQGAKWSTLDETHKIVVSFSSFKKEF